MLLFGVGSLFPWNAMITPVEYFQMRLRKTPYEQPFESVMSVAFCSVSFATVVVLQANPALLTMRKRILVSLSMLLVVFTTLTACAVQAALWPLDVFEQRLLAHADQQFAIILLSAAFAGVGQSLMTVASFSYAAIFARPRYLAAVSGGQGVAGLTVTAMSFVIGLPRVRQACAAQASRAATDDALTTALAADDRALALSAAFYFSSSLLVILLCIAGYFYVESLPFTLACKRIALRERAEEGDDGGRLASARDTGATDHVSSSLVETGAMGSPVERTALLSKQLRAARRSELRHLLWPWALSVYIIYLVTIAIFPALTVTISSGGGICGDNCTWGRLLGPTLFILFNLGDTVGRNLTWTISSPRKLLGLTSARVVFALLFMACHTSGTPRFRFLAFSDAPPFLIMALFALSNGWLTTSIFVSSQTVVAPTMRQEASSYLVLFLNGGIFSGALMSFLVKFLNCTPDEMNHYSCNPFALPSNVTSADCPTN